MTAYSTLVHWLRCDGCGREWRNDGHGVSQLRKNAKAQGWITTRAPQGEGNRDYCGRPECMP